MSYCRASHEKEALNLSTAGIFGGRGMGQTCGVADPSQFMKVFGVDIDTRDTTELIETARQCSPAEIEQARREIQPFFAEAIPDNKMAEQSIRLYLALKKIVENEGWDYYTIQSFPGLGDDYSATCLAQSMMQLEQGIGTSTLSDFNTATMVKLLTGLSKERVYYGDLQHSVKSNNEIKIIGDGTCPPSLAGEVRPARFAEQGIPTEGEAGGLAVELVCKQGEGVRLRQCERMRGARWGGFDPARWRTPAAQGGGDQRERPAVGSNRMKPERLRRMGVFINRRLKRGKAFEDNKVNGLLVLSLDANEQFCSDHRCCEDCLSREVTYKEAQGREVKKTQYYHKQVYAQLSGPKWSVILDFEPMRPGEEECAAALRLLRRMRQQYGARFFDLVVVDSW